MRHKGMSLCGNDLGDVKEHPIHGIKLYWDEYNGGGEEDSPAIDDCRIGHFSGDGFILDNWFSVNDGWGIKGGEVVSSVILPGNRVEWNHSGGFCFPFGDSYNFTGNFFDRSHGPAVQLGGENPVTLAALTGNIFRRSGAYVDKGFEDPYDSCHVRLQNCSNLTLIGNTMRVGKTMAEAASFLPIME